MMFHGRGTNHVEHINFPIHCFHTGSEPADVSRDITNHGTLRGAPYRLLELRLATVG